MIVPSFPSKSKVLCAVLLAPLAVGAATSPSVTAKPAKTMATKISWHPTFEQAMAAAKRSGKPIIVDFYADWCMPCKLLDRDVWPKSAVVRASRNWIAVKVDAEKRVDLTQRYGITGFPSIAFLKPNGDVIKIQTGLIVPSRYKTLKQQTDYLTRWMAQLMRTHYARAAVRSA